MRFNPFGQMIFNNFDPIKVNRGIESVQSVPMIDVETKEQSFVNILQVFDKRQAITLSLESDGTYRQPTQPN